MAEPGAASKALQRERGDEEREHAPRREHHPAGRAHDDRGQREEDRRVQTGEDAVGDVVVAEGREREDAEAGCPGQREDRAGEPTGDLTLEICRPKDRGREFSNRHCPRSIAGPRHRTVSPASFAAHLTPDREGGW